MKILRRWDVTYTFYSGGSKVRATVEVMASDPRDAAKLVRQEYEPREILTVKQHRSP